MGYFERDLGGNGNKGRIKEVWQGRYIGGRMKEILEEWEMRGKVTEILERNMGV
jgi:hypothetical protein